MLTRILNWLFSFFRPHPAPDIAVPEIIQRSQHQWSLRKPHNWQLSRIAKQRAQIDVVMAIGRGYDSVPVAAPEGYFWKQDQDGAHWRLYRQLPEQPNR